MKINEESFYNEDMLIENNIPIRKTENQKQLAARKRLEDYFAEKQLRKNIDDFDFGF